VSVFLLGGAWHSHSSGQTVGWIKMPLGKEVGLGPGVIVLDRDPAPQQPLPTFGPCLLWPNGRSCQQLLSSSFILTWNHGFTVFADIIYTIIAI